MNDKHTPDDLDRYVDELLEPAARAAFEARLALDAELGAQLELQRSLERSLRRSFAPPSRVSLPALVGAARAPRARVRRQALAAAAGVLLAASLAFVLARAARPAADAPVARTGAPIGSLVRDGEAGLALDGAYARLERELGAGFGACGPTLVPCSSWPLLAPGPDGSDLVLPGAPPDLVGCTLPELDAAPPELLPTYAQPPGFPIPVLLDTRRALHGPLALPAWPGALALAIEAGARPHFVFAVERAADPHPRLERDADVELVRGEAGEHVVYELKPVGQPSCIDLFCPRR